MEKPEFGFIETLGALAKLDKIQYRLFLIRFLGLFRNTSRGLKEEIEYQAGLIRMETGRILLGERMPVRNEDGSVSWPNFYAVCMQLNQPVKRSDIFPDGTDGMSDDEILKNAYDFLKPLSAKFNFSPPTTAYDPVEFPEVIDEDLRDMAAKVHKLEFGRSVSSCSGHAEGKKGYSSSVFSLCIDWNNPKSRVFYDRLVSLCDEFKTDKIVPKIINYGPIENGFCSIDIRLFIHTPDDWKENGLSPDVLDPKQYFEQLIPGYYKDNGFINADVSDNPNNKEKIKKAEQYTVEYYKRKNAYNNSDECKAIRDSFWDEVGKIADDLAKA